MQVRRVCSWIIAAAALGACAPRSEVAAGGAALTVRAPIDATPEALIVGSSADRRYIAYAAPCPAGGDAEGAPPTLKMLDDWTGAIATLGAGWCRPGAVRFSPDGRLAAFGVPDRDGVRVRDNADGRQVDVTPAGAFTLSIGFSPDSRWFVVASGQPGADMGLEAWSADLVHHVAVAERVYVNPSGEPEGTMRFSPDGGRVLFVAGVDGPYPVGTLTEWTRAGGRSRAIAQGVAAYVVADDFSRVAMLDGVTVDRSRPPSAWLHGRLAVRALDGDRLDVVAADVAAQPLTFTPAGALLYFAGALSGQQTLAAWIGGAPVTLDGGVFRGFPPAASVAVSPSGDEVAYVTGFDPPRFAGELHLARLPAPGEVAAPPRVVARDAVPTTLGWIGQRLAYLHAPTGSFPGGASGTLALWGAGRSRDLAADVAQPGLRIDAARGRIVYLDHFDPERAAGDLHVWSAWSGTRRLVGRDASVLSIALSPDGDRVGFLALDRQAPPDAPPPTALKLGTLSWPAPTRTVDDAVGSLAVGDGGRVVYGTAGGLFGAFVP